MKQASAAARALPASVELKLKKRFQEGGSEEVYCAEHPNTVGCPLEPIPCCRALNSQCLSCVEGMTEEDYCAIPENQFVAGCPAEDNFCCEALTSSCLSCQAGVSEEDYCEANPTTDGCEEEDDEEIGVCCLAMIPSCMACSAGVTEEEYCAATPTPFVCTGTEEPITGEPDAGTDTDTDTDTGSNPARGRGR